MELGAFEFLSGLFGDPAVEDRLRAEASANSLLHQGAELQDPVDIDAADIDAHLIEHDTEILKGNQPHHIGIFVVVCTGSGYRGAIQEVGG